MKHRRLRRICLPLLLAMAAIPALAGAEDTFSLSASAQDFDTYFPSYLANGYFSTMTAPRGTEGNLAYMVAFMDYGKDDESRPAAIPGWSEIDYSTGDSAAGHFWMNQVPVNAAHVCGLPPDAEHERGDLDDELSLRRSQAQHTGKSHDLCQPGLNASGRDPDFADAGFRRHRGTLVCLESLGAASAAPAARQTDRRANAGSGRREQYAARGDPPATPDRAAVWYHGDTHVLAANGDVKNLTLALDGRAEQGLSMAEAAAVALPDGVVPSDIALYKSQYRLALNVKIKVQKDRTYTFTKFVAASREGWGGDSQADVALATAARKRWVRCASRSASGRLARTVAL